MISDISILGQKFKIKLVTEETVRGKDTADAKYFGACDEVTRTIYINRNLKDDVFKRTLIHEIIHGHIRVPGHHEHMKYKVEEALCLTLENLLDLFTNAKFIELMNQAKVNHKEKQ